MPKVDLRLYKRELREKRKNSRMSLDPKQKESMDRRIAHRVISLKRYANANTVMIYASTPIEVDTFEIIDHALSHGKHVALPRCIKGTRNMEFYYINSTDDLERGTFNVLEPREGLTEVTDYSGALMIVPALGLDSFGYRLGYGGGYYDRYLARYDFDTVGICYADDYMYRMLHGRYDCPLGLIITERFVRRPNKTGVKITKKAQEDQNGSTE